MSKFKVGDKVKVIKNKPYDSADYIGITGVIDGIYFDCISSIDTEPMFYWYDDELELINPPKYILWNVTQDYRIGSAGNKLYTVDEAMEFANESRHIADEFELREVPKIAYRIVPKSKPVYELEEVDGL